MPAPVKKALAYKTAALILMISCLAPAASMAQDPAQGDTVAGLEIETVEVEARKPITAYSDRVIRDKDFLNFPRQNPSDLVRLIPGIHVNQHTGGGKAHQYFLRGFDAEHGQDLAGYFDGIPLNEVSHVHGQGYLDLFFIIPETLSSVHVIKGPYQPEYGNFAVAGAINFVPEVMPDKSRAKATYGSFNTWRIMAQAGARAGQAYVHAAADRERTDGFTEPGNMDASRAFLMLTRPFGQGNVARVLAAYYNSEYDAADVVPAKWIALDWLDRFDAVDHSCGGESYRSILGLTLSRERRDFVAGARAYYQDRESLIFSNYTYYLLHPEKGDQYEMRDNRSFYGADLWAAVKSDLAGVQAEHKVGVNLRSDRVDQAQYNTRDRDRFNTLFSYDFTESSAGVFVKEMVWPAKWLQVMAAARYDRVFYDVTGTRDVQNQAQTLEDQPLESRTWAEVISPRIALVISPIKNENAKVNSLDLFANYGIGFTTQRAAQSALPPPDHSIPKARMYEAAARASLLKNRLSVACGYWAADKEEELVFAPELGYATEKGESRRQGQDLELRYRPIEWLYLAFDLFHTKAEFVETGDPVPGTPEWLSTQTVTVRHPSGVRGAIRGRWEDGRPLLFGFSSREYWVMDLLAAYQADRWEIELELDNVFNREWDDTSFAYTSRPEPDGLSYTGLHITPGTPRAARISLSIRF